MEGREDTGWLHHDFTSGGGRSVVERRLIRGGGGEGGFAARISSTIRPQDPGGGATGIAALRGVVNMEDTSLSVSFKVEPQSVPSRISVVLVEEAKVRGTECLVSPSADKDPRLLAGMASPASVTVCEGGNISPSVVVTLSPSDSDGPVVPCGTLSPSDFVAVGPVGPDGTLSSSNLAGMLFPAVPAGILFTVGPVGPYGMLSRLTLTLLALLARMRRCPRLTLLAHMERCPRLTLLALLARMGCCPRLTLLL